MAKSNPINQYTLEGEFVQTFNSARAASFAVDLKSHSGITLCCQGNENSRQTAGFQWRYSKDCNGSDPIDPVRELGSVFKERYGVGSDGHASTQEKRRKTSNERYGSDHAMQNLKTKEKLQKTSMSKYGVINPAQDKRIRQKISKTERRTKSNEFISIFENEMIFIDLTEDDIFTFCHKICGHEFIINRQLLSVRKRNSSTICTICNPPEMGKTSEIERELFRMIDFTEKIPNVQGLVKTKHEIDIFLPSFSLGIEVNGIKFHSDAYGKGEKYHINKTKMFEEIGIQILHFFDDEIIERPDLVMDMIRTKCGLNRRIYARKCTIKSIENPVEFLGNNHLQGNLASSVAYGLFYEGELVSCMTFGPLRKILGYNDREGWEMLRFCNSLGVNVVGGASKLLKRFIEDHKPDQIISYANLRWSNGSLYRKLGFTEDGRTSPGYFYFWKNRRVHRYTLRKSELVKMGHDPAKTAEEIIQEIQVPKIYDCGNIRFIWNAP